MSLNNLSILLVHTQAQEDISIGQGSGSHQDLAWNLASIGTDITTWLFKDFSTFMLSLM